MGQWGRAVAVVAFACALMAAPARAGTVTAIDVPARGGELPAGAWKYAGPPKANVLLPDGYDPAKEYPFVLLLHGFNSTYKWWVNYAHAADVLAKLDAIVVMPEGASGWYTDWFNGGRRGAPAWESYVLDQVLPQVRERYRIRPERRYHALVGVSMGGLGATYLGGRLPGFFGSVASISGFVDPERAPGGARFQSVLAGASDLDAVAGPADGPYARGHNPRRLLANLAHTRLYVTSGDGTLSERGAEPGNEPNVPVAIATEALIRGLNDSYAAAARAAGLDVTYVPHAGIHDAPDFAFDLAGALRWGLFEPVDEAPTSWTNDTVATHGELWGIGYRFDPAPDGVVRFRRSGDRLSIAGAGSTVALTFPGGCSASVALPASVDIPRSSCTPAAALRVRVTPRTVTRGKRTRMTVRTAPAVPGALVRLGKYRVRTDARGRATIRGCFKTTGARTLVVAAPGYRRATVGVRIRGSARRCPG